MAQTRHRSGPTPVEQAAANAPAAKSPVAAAIRSLGRSIFPEAFARIAGTNFQTDQVVVFRSDGPGRIRTLIAQNSVEGTGRAQQLAERYRSDFWSKDPHRPLLLPAAAEERDVMLLATRVEDIDDREYRQSLFIQPRLGAKAALVVRAPDHVLYVNLYRGIDRPPFMSEELEIIRRSSGVLVALIEQHFALTNDEAASDLNAVQRLIAEVARERGAPLSMRESDTCARIVAGYSTEGISLSLGVSQHTVISYRRRAFEKLGIATQKELFAMVLQRHRLLGR